MNKLHVLPFKQVSYHSQRRKKKSGSAVEHSPYHLHKKVSLFFIKLQLPSRSRSAEGSNSVGLIKEESALANVWSVSSVFITSEVKKNLKSKTRNRMQSSAVWKAGLQGLRLIAAEG